MSTRKTYTEKERVDAVRRASAALEHLALVLYGVKLNDVEARYLGETMASTVKIIAITQKLKRIDKKRAATKPPKRKQPASKSKRSRAV